MLHQRLTKLFYSGDVQREHCILSQSVYLDSYVCVINELCVQGMYVIGTLLQIVKASEIKNNTP